MNRWSIDPNQIERLFQKRTLSPKAQKIVRISVGFIWGGFLLILLWSAWRNWDQITPLLTNLQYSQLINAIIFYFADLIAVMIGWIAIVRTFDRSPGWWKNLQIYSFTIAARRLPGTFWYVGGRLIMYQEIGMSKLSVLVASAVELIVTFATAGCVGLGIFLLIGENLPVLLMVVIAFVALSGLFLIYPGITKKLSKRKDIPNTNHAKFKDWLLWIISTSVGWIMGGLMVLQFVKVFQPVLSMRDNLYVLGAWALSGMAGFLTIFLPSSFGATELSLMVFLTQLLPLPIAGTIAIAIRLFTLLMEILLSAVFYPIVMKRSPK
jgi:hypothetical protein